VQILAFITGSISGFLFNHLATRNNTRINRKLPYLKLKFLQVSPTIKIHFKNRTIHLHHWLNYTIILIVTLTYSVGVFDSIPSKGFIIGSIIQGFTFPDWKNIIQKKDLNS